LAAIFVSAILALPAMLLLRNEEDEETLQVPFIPFLAMATLLVFIFDIQVMDYLDSLYG
jgi:leader peptidase (prepilin peptidase)/N-methyltransferase